MKHMAFVMALVAIAGCSKGERKPAAGDTTSMMMSSDTSQMSMSDTAHSGMRSDSAHMMAPDTSKMKMSSRGQVSADPARVSADPAMVERGQDIYKKKGCAACHNIAKAGEEPHRRPGGKQAGPDLAGVTERRDHSWLRRFLKDTEKMLETDPTAKAMVAQAQGLKMPNPKLTDEEIEAVIAYLSVPQ